MAQHQDDRDLTHTATDQFEMGPVHGRSRSRRRIAAFAGVSLVLFAVMAAFMLKGRSYVIELTEEQIQQELDANFPMEKRYLLILAIILSEPKVHLVAGADRVMFGVKASVNVRLAGQAKRLGGRGTITTGLRYNSDDYSFYLYEPTIDELDVQGVPVGYVDRVNDMAARLIHERISRTPVYTLDRTDMKQFAAGLVLKKVNIRDDKLVIRLGL